MEFQLNYWMTPVGVGIIAVYSAAIVMLFVWPMVRLLRGYRVSRWLFIGTIALPLLAAPWLEELWIAYRFANFCQDAGVYVSERVTAKGYFDAVGGGTKPQSQTLVPESRMHEYTARGFEFVEQQLSPGEGGKVVRLERTVDGWTQQIIDAPTARYHYRNSYQPTPYRIEEPMGYKIQKLEQVVIDSEQGNRVIARNTSFRRIVGVAEGSWRLFFGLAKSTCTGQKPPRPILPLDVFEKRSRDPSPPASPLETEAVAEQLR